MKTQTLYFIFYIFLTVLISSCSRDIGDDPIPEIKPIVKLEVTDYDDGEYLLDASTSTDAEDVKWSVPGVIDNPTWQSFYSASTKTITVPDPTKDYTVTVTVRNEYGESSKSKTLTGKPIEVKYSNFESLEEMLANPYISDAIAANSMEIYTGSSPLSLVGNYEVLKKENHKVSIDGVVSDFEDGSWDGDYWFNWRAFTCKIGADEIHSIYSSGRSERKSSYKIAGEGDKFTIYFQGEVNPWYTKLNSTGYYGPSGELMSNDYAGTHVPAGVHIVAGEKLEDGSIKLSVLWIHVWEDEASSSTNWSYNEYHVEPEGDYGYGTFTDPRDGRVYKTIKIGNQTWFAENLKYEPKEADGYTGYQHWQEGVENDGDDKFYTWPTDTESAKELSGIGYTWTAATGLHVDEKVATGEVVQGVCPEGWHVPTAAEWGDLIDYLGGKKVAGGKLKSRVGWIQDVCSNETGFNFGWSTNVNGMTAPNTPELVVGRGTIRDNSILTIGEDGSISYGVVSFYNDEAYYSASIPGGPNWHGKFGGFVIRCIKNE